MFNFIFIARISGRRDVMGRHTSRFWSTIGLWSAFAVMATAAIALLVSLL